MFLRTERLIIRRFRLEDAPAFAAYRSDPDVARYQSWSAPFALDAAQALVTAFTEDDPLRPGWFQYALETVAENALIGDIGVNLHENRKQAEIGFSLASSWQGHGYAFEAVSAMLDHLFVERRLHRVSAESDARNTSSARLLERLGFTREGLRRQHTWIKGEWTDELLFGLLAEDWLSRR